MILPTVYQHSILDLYLKPLAEVEKTLSFPNTPHELQAFFQVINHNKVGSYLYLQLEKLRLRGHSIPLKITSPLKSIYDALLEKNSKRLKSGFVILKDLKQAGVQVIILKGNAIAQEYYGNIGYKPMNDIDILIQKKDIPLVHEIFLKHKLLCAAPLEKDIRKQEKYSHHWPPFFTPTLDVFFGTHWDICTPLRGIKTPLEDFWTQKEEFVLEGETFFRLSPIHFLFHLCIHLNLAKTGLKEIGDLVKVIEHREKELKAQDFAQLAINTNAIDATYEAIALTHALNPSAYTTQILNHLSDYISSSNKRRIQKRCEPKEKILELRTSYISKIEKTFAMFMLTEMPIEKTFLLAKMWKLNFFVPVNEALRLSYESQSATVFTKIKSVIMAPIRIGHIFIRDLGLPIFLIVSLRHQWILLESYIHYILCRIQGKPLRSLESFAQNLGLTFDQVKEISGQD